MSGNKRTAQRFVTLVRPECPSYMDSKWVRTVMILFLRPNEHSGMSTLSHHLYLSRLASSCYAFLRLSSFVGFLVYCKGVNFSSLGEIVSFSNYIVKPIANGPIL